MLEFILDSLFDLYIYRGNLGKWLISRTLDAAAFLFLCLTILSFDADWYVLGVLGVSVTIFLTVLDWKFTSRTIKERAQGRRSPEKEN